MSFRGAITNFVQAAIRANKFPPALDNELQIIDQVVQYGLLRTKNTTQQNATKAEGKPESRPTAPITSQVPGWANWALSGPDMAAPEKGSRW